MTRILFHIEIPFTHKYTAPTQHWVSALTTDHWPVGDVAIFIADLHLWISLAIIAFECRCIAILLWYAVLVSVLVSVLVPTAVRQSDRHYNAITTKSIVGDNWTQNSFADELNRTELCYWLLGKDFVVIPIVMAFGLNIDFGSIFVEQLFRLPIDSTIAHTLAHMGWQSTRNGLTIGSQFSSRLITIRIDVINNVNDVQSNSVDSRQLSASLAFSELSQPLPTVWPPIIHFNHAIDCECKLVFSAKAIRLDIWRDQLMRDISRH